MVNQVLTASRQSCGKRERSGHARANRSEAPDGLEFLRYPANPRLWAHRKPGRADGRRSRNLKRTAAIIHVRGLVSSRSDLSRAAGLVDAGSSGCRRSSLRSCAIAFAANLLSDLRGRAPASCSHARCLIAPALRPGHRRLASAANGPSSSPAVRRGVAVTRLDAWRPARASRSICSMGSASSHAVGIALSCGTR